MSFIYGLPVQHLPIYNHKLSYFTHWTSTLDLTDLNVVGRTRPRFERRRWRTSPYAARLDTSAGQTSRCAAEVGTLLIPPLPAVHIAVAGADGVGGNARSWAIVAKAGMRQADAPEENARPRSSPQINDISRAKGKATPAHLPFPSHIAACWEKGGASAGVFSYTVGRMKNSL